jgi:glycosyltransferase involved in cell wall biosynthesis
MRTPEAHGAPWVIVAPGFHRAGGMEKANLALARHLAERGTPVHLVGHAIDDDLAGRPGVAANVVPRARGSFLLADRALARRGRAVARQVSALDPRTRVVVNGGNCDWGDVNWVHCVHHAWAQSHIGAPLWFRVRSDLLAAAARRDERARVPAARLVLANSELTKEHLTTLVGVSPARVRTQYLGADPAWGPPSDGERRAAREWLGIPADRPVVAFVGVLGYDTRKGFDVLLEAWSRLAARGWDARLVAAGGGRGHEQWSARVREAGLQEQVRLLGITDRVVHLLAAADLLVSPVRYESYGLNVQEALCRGVPAMVSGRAGIAERYPADLRDLVLDDPEDVDALVERLLAWRESLDSWRARVAGFSAELRAYSWDRMAADIVALVEAEAEADVQAG